MKAIETIYKGYRFRSRLEARWAVFFDALGYEWEYEPEGYEMSGGERYLPDFRVRYPGRGPDEVHYEWFEVKPGLTLISADEWLKMIAWSRESGERLTILDGVPDRRMYCSICDIATDGAWDTGDNEEGSPKEWVVPSAKTLSGFTCRDRFGAALACCRGRLWWDEWNIWFEGPYPYHEPLETAIKTARAFRFWPGPRATT